MIIFFVLIGMLVIGIILCRRGSTWEIGMMIAVVAGLLLIITSTILPISYYGGLADVREYHAFKNTITKARTSASEAERTAILMKITSWNQSLASTRYWNKTIFDIFIPDELAELPDIE